VRCARIITRSVCGETSEGGEVIETCAVVLSLGQVDRRRS
jgi:hypothetical protein